MSMFGIDDNVFVALSLYGAVKASLTYFIYKTNKIPKHARYVGIVSSLRLYPIKSCKGLLLQEALCTSEGLGTIGDRDNKCTLLDRHFLVAKENGSFLSQRAEPRMCLIDATLKGSKLTLSAPDAADIQVPFDEAELKASKATKCSVWGFPLEGVDCGDEVAQWLSKFLGISVRLLANVDSCRKRDVLWHPMAKPEDTVVFSDLAPYLLTNDNSVEDLNTRLTSPIDARHFRPNISVKGDVPAWDEDDWDCIYIGDASFTNFRKCTRCVMTTVNPDKGTFHSQREPLVILEKFRICKADDPTRPTFGIHLLLDRPGKVAVGDRVYVTYK